MSEISFCPCGSGTLYLKCCGPLLSDNQNAESAEALMRSRYTASCLHDVSYLLKTWHPTTRPTNIDPKNIPRWSKLEIIQTEKGTIQDTEGTVAFRATAVSEEGAVVTLQEVSRFIKQGNRWFYIEGTMKEDEEGSTPAKKQKVGRNSPCPCGSGKKFKKCCGP